MMAEIITIGDEILSGDIVDSNSAYLSEKLISHGVAVDYHCSVRDDAQAIRKALLAAAERSRVVLVTGGLGPTADDFTLEIAAKTFRRPLVTDEAYLKYLENLAKKWGRKLNENNKKQACVPKGARLYQNKVGTAPGVGLTYKQTRFYFLPGVPKEMKQLFEDYVLPQILSEQSATRFFMSRLYKCFGIAESDIDHRFKDLYQDRLMIDGVRVGFRAHFPETFIKLSAWGDDPELLGQVITQTENKVKQRIGEFIYGGSDDSLEAVVGRLLQEKKRTVALAESCTGGMIANRITNIPGASLYFKNGVVSYSNEAKIAVLGVSKDVIAKEGAVSARCAIEMAQGVRRISKVDYGIAVTGIAGPSGGSPGKAVGTVHIALATQNGTKEKGYHFPMNRDWFKLMVSSLALDWLRKELLGDQASTQAA